jgi:hypothetical protein
MIRPFRPNCRYIHVVDQNLEERLRARVKERFSNY